MVDTSIITQGQHPVQDPLQAQLAVQNARAQQQENALRLQSANLGVQGSQLDLQQKQKGIADEDALHQLFLHSSAPAEADIYKAVQDPTKAFQVVSAMRASTKAGLETQKLQTDLAAAQSDMLGHAARGLKEAGVNDVSVWTAAQHLAAAGPAGQQAAQTLMTAYKQGGPQAVSPLLDQAISGSKEASAAESAAVTAKSKADAQLREQQQFAITKPKLEAEAEIAQATAAGKAPIQPYQQATLDESQKRDQNQAANERQRLGIQRQELGLSQARLSDSRAAMGLGPDGKLLSPDQIKVSPAAIAIVEGRTDPVTARTMMRNNKSLANEVQAYSGNKFDEARLETKFQANREFGGTSLQTAGGQANAINTAASHAGLFIDAAKALKNGQFVPGNALYNKFAETFGSAPPQNVKQLGSFMVDEATKGAIGGVPGQEQLKSQTAMITPSASEDQLMAYGHNVLNILGHKASVLNEKGRNSDLVPGSAGTSKNRKAFNVINDGAADVYARNGFDPETLTPINKGPDTAAPSGNPKIDSLRSKYKY